jgi:large subunit ribosomal protein L9
VANPEALKAVKAEMETRARSEAKTEAELLELAKELEGKEIILTARTGAKQRLYGSITSADIAVELERVTKLAFDKRKIELNEPIRQVGSYDVVIRLGKDIAPKIKVTVNEKTE